jgi:NAD(P)-dependent dehydrogenase (short-subunit alcohol dehydrogenase family)
MSARFDFSDRNVFITGGSSGIGASLVESFAQAGASVVFSFKTNADAAHTAIQTLQQRFPHQQFDTIFLDLSDSSETAVAKSFETVLMRLGGRIDIGVLAEHLCSC